MFPKHGMELQKIGSKDAEYGMDTVDKDVDNGNWGKSCVHCGSFKPRRLSRMIDRLTELVLQYSELTYATQRERE